MYITSEMPVQHPSQFQVRIWTYKFKFKREANPEDLSMEDSSVLVVIML